MDCLPCTVSHLDCCCKPTYPAPPLLQALHGAPVGSGYRQIPWDSTTIEPACFLNSATTSPCAGALFVAAAGNELACNDEVLTYPASYKLENVVAGALQMKQKFKITSYKLP